MDKNHPNKQKPRLLAKEIKAFLNHKIHQVLIEMLDKDSTYPSTDSDTPQKVNQVSITGEQEEIDYFIHQILDPKYKYDLSPLSKQIEPSIISSIEYSCINITK